MSALLPLRPYQAQCLDALDERWKTDGNRLAVVLPTGGGKTVIFSHLSKRHLDANPGDRVLILVHTDELVQQAAAKVRTIAPHLSVGIVKAARNEVTADVIVASVQSLRSEKRRKQIRGVGLVIVDECHHATANTYRTILEHYGCMESTLAAGFTATLMRGDGGPLGEVWQGVAFSRDVGYMVRKRYLVPPRGQAVRVPDFNLAMVRSTKADFREGDLGSALVNSLAPSVVAQSYREHASERSGILFCPTVASAEAFAEAFNLGGIACEVIHGNLPQDERRAILARLESGQTQVVANCMVLTEGFDSPRVSCVVVARPTKSKGLYIQMVGRGLRVDPLRPYEDQDCLVLDVVGASATHDLRSIADLSDKPLDEAKARAGKSLIDLEDEFDRGEDEEPDEDDPTQYHGPVEVKEFDPLAAKSTRAWGKTKAGHYYLPAGWSTREHPNRGAYVFLVPAGTGPYTVSWCTATGGAYDCPARVHDVECEARHGRKGAITEHRGLDLETALGWAEDLAVDMGADPYESATKKTAPWRRKPASPAQLGTARQHGCPVRDGMRAGEVSDMIDKVKASGIVDQWATRVAAALNTERVEQAA